MPFIGACQHCRASPRRAGCYVHAGVPGAPGIRRETCPDCWGAGVRDTPGALCGTPRQTCGLCRGTGLLHVSERAWRQRLDREPEEAPV